MKELLRWLIRKIAGIEFTEILKEGIEYRFQRLYYIGMWAALYNYPYPRKDKFVKQKCSYYYFEPKYIAEMLGLKYKSGKSVQIKYFYYGFCEDTYTWHTVIYECNVYDDFLVEWGYGQELKFEIMKYRRKLKLVPYKKDGKPYRWLLPTMGWNRHCHFYLGFDQSATQYFVIKESTY